MDEIVTADTRSTELRSCVEGVRAGASKPAVLNEVADRPSAAADYCNKICQQRTSAMTLAVVIARATRHRENLRLNELPVLMSHATGRCGAVSFSPSLSWRRTKNLASGELRGRYPGYAQQGGFHESKDRRNCLHRRCCGCFVD